MGGSSRFRLPVHANLETSLRYPFNLQVLAAVGVAMVACRSPPTGGGAPLSDTAVRHDPVIPAAAAVAPRDAMVPEAAASQSGVESLSPEQRAAAQRFEAKYCRKHDCCATSVWPFGPDRRGRHLAVIGFESDEPCLLPQKPRKASKHRDEPEEEEGDESENQRHACRQHWLIDVDGAKPPIHVSLAKRCDDDKWEGGAGVDLETRTFSHGGHSLFNNTQTEENTVIGLDPLRLIETSTGIQSLQELHDVKWNWDEMAGTIDEGHNYCSGKEPPDAGLSNDRDSPEIDTLSVVIPSASLPAEFVGGGWRSTGLGRCAALIDGTRGFVLRGAPGTAADSTMRVLFASTHDTLFVEVTDDHFVGQAKSWVKADHLELWSAPNPPACVDVAAKSPALQWGIRIRDGAVFPGFGAPESTPAVEIARVAKDAGTVRLKITFATATLTDQAFTAVYSDSDDGIHQKRLIATSSLEYGKWWTLGVPPDDEHVLTCRVERGVLVPRRPPFPGK